jgi:hypothetical protein
LRYYINHINQLERNMTKYQIESKAGEVFGTYEGDTPEEAFAAMCVEAGDEPGSEASGTAQDWIITVAE